MTDTGLVTNLRHRRTEAALSQSELAERVGLSRQAIIAIEAGRQVPSTAVALELARALRCSVEDLFTLSAGSTFLASLAKEKTNRRIARLAVGRVDGAWAAHPIDSDDQPADGLLVEGGAVRGRVHVEPLCDLTELEKNVLVAGCAPLLGVLTGAFGRRREDARATWIPANSTRALELLSKNQVHVAGLHLVDADAPTGHARVVQRRFPAQKTTIVNLTRWRQGLVVANGNPLGIRDVGDVLRADVRWIVREPGAGAQRLLERLLAAKKIPKSKLAHGLVASGHAEVARLIRLGLADVGVAIEAAALAEGLDFIPLTEERFDLVVPEARLETRPVARLFDLIERAAFQADAGHIQGYDFSTAGHAVTVAAG